MDRPNKVFGTLRARVEHAFADFQSRYLLFKQKLTLSDETIEKLFVLCWTNRSDTASDNLVEKNGCSTNVVERPFY